MAEQITNLIEASFYLQCTIAHKFNNDSLETRICDIFGQKAAPSSTSNRLSTA